MKTKSILFLDGEFLPSTEILEKNLAPGHLMGRGVYETLRGYSGRTFALDEHLRRMSKGLKILYLPLPFSKKEIEQHISFILKTNRLKNARVRILVWEDASVKHAAVTAIPYHPPSAQKYKKGFCAEFAAKRCQSDQRQPEVKSIQHQFYLFANARALNQGYDEALLLNDRGEIAEGSRSNIFFVKDGKLFTPALRCGSLRGITREITLTLVRKSGHLCKEIAASPQDLIQAQEAFLTSSLLEVMPLTWVGKFRIGNGKPGAMTKCLQKAYRNLVRGQVSF